MRLFVGVEIEPELRAALAETGHRLRDRLARRVPDARLTWVPPVRLHFTISFLGEVEKGGVQHVVDALRPPVDRAPFTLTVAGLGAFPSSGAPKVIWAGTAAGRESMVDLAQRVSARLGLYAVAPDTRPYTPHLTLARVRQAGSLRVHDVMEAFVAEPPTIGTTRVEAITLFESRFSASGPTYVPLQQTALNGA